MGTTGQYCFIISVVTTSACNLGQPGNRREQYPTPGKSSPSQLWINIYLAAGSRHRYCSVARGFEALPMMHLQVATNRLSFQAQAPSLGSQQHSFRHMKDMQKLLRESNTNYMIQLILQLYAGRGLFLHNMHCILPTTSTAHNFFVNTGSKACKANHQPIKKPSTDGCSTVVL